MESGNKPLAGADRYRLGGLPGAVDPPGSQAAIGTGERVGAVAPVRPAAMHEGVS